MKATHKLIMENQVFKGSKQECLDKAKSIGITLRKTKIMKATVKNYNIVPLPSFLTKWIIEMANEYGFDVQKTNVGYSSGSPYVKVYMNESLEATKRFRDKLEHELYVYDGIEHELKKPEFVLALDEMISFK